MKRILKAFILLLFFSMLPVPVSAHPGKTDSAGGHTNRDTGEYHYHHGYSAHQHYDMDGDRIVDCPYDFNDQTGHDSGSSANSSNIYALPATRSTVPPIVITTESKTAKEVKSVPGWVYLVFFITACIILFMWRTIRSRDAEIETMQNRHYTELAEVKKKHEKELWSAQEKVEKNLSEKSASDNHLAAANERLSKTKDEYRSVFAQLESVRNDLEDIKKQRKMYAEAPPDVTFAKDGRPVYWRPNKNKPYGDYTVYISLRTNVYHTDRFCASSISREAHLFDAMDRYRPCKKCAENAFDFKDVPNWYDPR